MERYQLSQDFQEKQLQLLQRKYGGPEHAMQAALTIQRAFRRYSMGKKFADLTAHAKSEKRNSRRLEFQNASPPPPMLLQPATSDASVSGGNGTEVAKTEVDETDAPLPFHHHHQHHHHHHHHHVNHQRRMYVHHRSAASSPTTATTTPECRHQVSRVEVAPSVVAAPAASAAGTVLRQSPVQSGLEGESSNSCPDIQSFPLDETSVYSHSPSSCSAARHSPGSAERHSQRSAGSPDDSGRGKKISGNNNSPAALAAAGPSVPRRTISRLSSMEKPKGNSSRRSPLQQHQSSPQILSSSSLRHHSHSSSTTSPEECRMLRHNISYRVNESNSYSLNEVIRKRHYRTGLNIFNKKPEKGIAYLIRQGFLENAPQAVARFLITRKGLSKQMIGEYLGNLNYQFNMSTLNYFSMEMDFSGMQIDTALRKFQTYFRMPGEAQKIERLMEVFSSRYCQCNPELVSKFQSSDTTFILAFAIILLNTDLHTPSLKPEKRMKLEDFVRNLRGIDNGQDVEHDVLAGIYDRIRNQEFRPGSDHVTQVMKVQQTIVAKCPNLAVPHRRLVCYCRLYEVHDPYKKERPGIHQREVFLFNDILVITKIHSRKKNTVTYAFRQSHLLAGMMVNLFETPFYLYGIQIAQKWDRKVVLLLNARNEHDRSKFVEDLKESVAEMDEMETLRLEGELEKQRLSLNDNRDSGINDHSTSTSAVDQSGQPLKNSSASQSSSAAAATVNANGVMLRRSAINNSLLDLTEAIVDKITRRGSVGSLDSGMSVSCQSNSVGSFCIGNGGHHHHQASRMLKEDCINRNDRNFRLSHHKQ